ncbi:LCP family protein [uncultured Streptomyces sp.]|uniref:LCP family protein n=1 Tax=uncultured Streptomyces sp. TaxID=174707 RepID=UPI002613717A|nr:LCP family protein [uncultured Streptomyces sp.]
MNDRQNPYDPYGQQPQIIGYDAYGQPVYQQPGQQQYDGYPPEQTPQAPGDGGAQGGQYAQQPGQGGPAGYGYDYGYDPYAQQQPQGYQPYAGGTQAAPVQQTGQAQTAPGQETGPPYAYGGHGHDTGLHAAVPTQQWNIPQQSVAPEAPAPQAAGPAVPGAVPGQRRTEPDYRTEQFAFIEEPDEDSEDVIDWLKFTESRSERREEARRRGRHRMVALIVVVALVVVGGIGYLWSAGKIPGLSDEEAGATTVAGAQKRDVIVVHLHDTKHGGTSTALLVDNVTTRRGTTILLPNSLAVANDDGATTTLGKSVDEDGSTGTRESIDTLLGTRITGTWRLDTPYLENLVELVGTIEVDTDTDVPDPKKGAAPVVREGKAQTLSGTMAVAYATYRAPGEAEAKQLTRFGQVMRGVLRKLSQDPKAATVTVQTLAQILDPSLPEADLGASLAKLASHAKVGDYATELLPVEADGTLTDAAVRNVVKEVLGGAVKSPAKDAPLRVAVKDTTGDAKAVNAARAAVLNGGYAYVDGGKADAGTSSQVIYGSAEDKPAAAEVAKTLGLPATAVEQGEPSANADVSVVLGQDYAYE